MRAAFAMVLLAIATGVPRFEWHLDPESRPDGVDVIPTLALHVLRTTRRGGGLQWLANCRACHAVDDALGPGPLSPASESTPAAPTRQPAPHGDAAHVRAGGDVYTRVCASCHAAAAGDASGAATSLTLARFGDESRSAPLKGCAKSGPAMPGIDRPTAASVNNLSDEQIAALAAFLRRHAPEVRLPRERVRATL